jgi:hypothetical protein
MAVENGCSKYGSPSFVTTGTSRESVKFRGILAFCQRNMKPISKYRLKKEENRNVKAKDEEELRFS